jgi:class 3 adenylate cyclase
MDQPGPSNVIPFPAHRRGTIEDTLSGFAGRDRAEGWFTERAERPATSLFVELRGWRTIVDLAGPVQAEETLARVVHRALEALSALGAGELTVGGEPMQPVLSCWFEGEGHGLRGLLAASAVREAADEAQLSALPGHRFQACAGLSSGTVVDAAVGAEADLRFRSVGTIRMFAARLQEFAGPGQVFLSRDTAEAAAPRARVRSIGEVRVNAAGERREAFLLTGIAGHSSTTGAADAVAPQAPGITQD